MSTRMKDIARDLGVSVVTISKVLRNHPDVGDETLERSWPVFASSITVQIWLHEVWSRARHSL
jgi:hypothetical protein